MPSTNVHQYLAFRPPQRTWWVYELGAQVRKHKYGKSPHSKKPLSSTDHSNCPIDYNYIRRKILVKEPKLQILYKDTKNLKDRKTPSNCSSPMNAIKPITSNHSVKEVPEFKIITFLLIPDEESPERSS
jgi:hypothetical protein